VTKEMVHEVLHQFIGEIMQEPPIFSAKFIGGVRAYKYARKGKDIKLTGNRISIRSLELLKFDLPYLSIRIECSKGTYIRALARDIGRALHSGAHLTSLLRSKIGDYHVENSLTVEEFERNVFFL
jgi:tRNA pseudouridine55 synthase